MLLPEVVLNSLVATLAIVATPGSCRDGKNFTHLASNSSHRLVCGLASHLTGALGVALLSLQNFFTRCCSTW